MKSFQRYIYQKIGPVAPAPCITLVSAHLPDINWLLGKMSGIVKAFNKRNQRDDKKPRYARRSIPDNLLLHHLQFIFIMSARFDVPWRIWHLAPGVFNFDYQIKLREFPMKLSWEKPFDVRPFCLPSSVKKTCFPPTRNRCETNFIIEFTNSFSAEGLLCFFGLLAVCVTICTDCSLPCPRCCWAHCLLLIHFKVERF